jgi:hypothetical protein
MASSPTRTAPLSAKATQEGIQLCNMVRVVSPLFVVAGDAGVSVAQVDGDDSPRRVRRRVGRPVVVQ